LIHHILSSCLDDELWLAVFGALISTLVTHGTNTKWGASIDDQLAFRVPLYIGLTIPTVCAIFELCILVESLWWLLLKCKKEQARNSLEYLHSWQKKVDINAKFAELEYTLRKEAESKELQKQSSHFECFKGVDLRRSLSLSFPRPAITWQATISMCSTRPVGLTSGSQGRAHSSDRLLPDCWLGESSGQRCRHHGAYISGRGVQSLKRGCQWSTWPQMSSPPSSLRTRGSAGGLCSRLASSP
jgi:hypothetical protein